MFVGMESWPAGVNGRGPTEDLRRALMEGRQSVPALGAVVGGLTPDLPFLVVGSDGDHLEPVSAYLRDMRLGDASPLTCRSYGFDLLRWHRLLWCLGVGWDRATEADIATLVGWLRWPAIPNGSTADLARHRRGL
jgi:hypothetical protein